MMRIYVVHQSKLISPLEAPACDAWLLNQPLKSTMEQIFRKAGLTPVPCGSWEEAESRAGQESNGACVISDAVACSYIVLKNFIRQARARRGPVSLMCAIPRARATDYTARADGLMPGKAGTSAQEVWTAPLCFLRGKTRLAQAEPVVIPYKEQIMRFSIPPGLIGEEEAVFALSESYICEIKHWVHIQRANMAALSAYWLERLRMFGYIGGVSWYLWRLLAGFPWSAGRLLEAVKQVSLRAHVHHRAYVEMSVVEKGARLLPHAMVSKSYIAEGAVIMEGAQVIGSVIGKGAYVARNSIVVSSVVYPRALASQSIMQASILGEAACALSESGFFDVNFFRNVRVAQQGRYIDLQTRYLGACAGPGSRIAGGVYISSGREIPAGALLIKDPADVFSNFDQVKPGMAAVCRDGSAAILGKESGILEPIPYYNMKNEYEAFNQTQSRNQKSAEDPADQPLT